MAMNETDRGWQELQDRIQNVFGNFLRGDVPSIEYKPPSVIHLLEMSAGYRENKAQELK